MILNAYYDESGTHGGSTVTVMAGLVGDVNDWIEFDREWNKVLRKHEITHVHAKHLYHRQGMYRGWREKKCWELIADLMYVIQERKQLFISRSFLLEDHYLRVYRAKKPERRERLEFQVCTLLSGISAFSTQPSSRSLYARDHELYS